MLYKGEARITQTLAELGDVPVRRMAFQEKEGVRLLAVAYNTAIQIFRQSMQPRSF